MSRYDRNYEPPAPVCELNVRLLPEGGQSLKVSFLMDSGSNVTVLPESVFQALRRSTSRAISKKVKISHFDSSHPDTYTHAYQISLSTDDGRSFPTWCLIHPEEGIVGRDVMRHLVLTLHGPGEYWSESSVGTQESLKPRTPAMDGAV